jgi:hypothetical protein
LSFHKQEERSVKTTSAVHLSFSIRAPNLLIAKSYRFQKYNFIKSEFSEGGNQLFTVFYGEKGSIFNLNKPLP